MITVVGIGFCRGDISVKGQKAVRGADGVVARTLLSPAGRAFKNAAQSLDELYETCQSFDELDVQCAAEVERLHAELLQKNANARLVYLVEGEGGSDGSAKILLGNGAELIAGAVGGFRGGARLLVTAAELCAQPCLLDSAFNVLVTGVDNRDIAGQVKLKLLESYPYDAAALITAGGKTLETTLEEIDRQKKYGCDTVIFVAGNAALQKERYTLGDLARIMARLTADDGCPWDKAQTHKSIAINLVEEAYEAADALLRGDVDDMAEEVGDVLLQAIFHCDIAARCGEFELGDVVTTLCRKLVFRHTHIFGDNKAADPDQALSFWEKAKAVEKSYSTVAEQLERLPENFPSLLKLAKTHKKAKKAGLATGADEIFEGLAASAQRLAGADGRTAQAASDALYYAALACAELGVDAETELLGRTNGYARRIINDENGKNN